MKLLLDPGLPRSAVLRQRSKKKPGTFFYLMPGENRGYPGERLLEGVNRKHQRASVGSGAAPTVLFRTAGGRRAI